jgi:hypothetical protein
MLDKYTTEWRTTLECVPSGKSFSPSGTYAESTWSGWQVGNTTAKSHYVQAAWRVPVVTTPPYPIPQFQIATGVTYMSGTWVGLGCGQLYGASCDNSHPLIQTGTKEEVNPINGQVTYAFWYEIWPDNYYTFDNSWDGKPMDIQAGDEVAADVFWMPQDNIAQLGVCNFTRNTCVNTYISNFIAYNTDGANVNSVAEPDTAEWVHEAPFWGWYGIGIIPTFSQINFTNACWAPTITYINTGTELIGSVNCQPITAGASQLPLQYNQLQMSTPSPIGPTGSDFYIYNGP